MKARLGTIVAAVAVLLAGTSEAALADESENSTSIASRSQAGYPVAGQMAGTGNAVLAVGNCGVQVNLPHPSYTTNNQIHTRVESFCQGNTIVNNKIVGKSYRSRWYGWQHRKTKSAGPKTAWRVRVTVDVNCDYGTWHRWRTEGYGSGILNGQPVSAAAYEENDDEIKCGANN